MVLSIKYDLAILSFDENGIVRTRAFGHVADRVGRPAETGIITCVHESGVFFSFFIIFLFVKSFSWLLFEFMTVI